MRDDPFEVLMVRRSSRGSFASALVFPGGALEPDDASPQWEPLIEDYAAFGAGERARRIAAIRETWEETSILVGAVGEVPPVGIEIEIEIEIEIGLGLRDFLRRSNLSLRLDSLTTLAHWITPITEPRRFDTRFYVAHAPEGQVAVADGNEIVGIEWVAPGEAAGAARRGESPIIFPTLMNLERLAEAASAEAAIATALSRPAFTVRPVIETNPDGSRVIVIPAEAGYAVTRFSP